MTHPSAEFLRLFHGAPEAQPWPLTAIDPHRRVEARSFDAERAAVDWVDAKVLGGCNVYFNPATPKGRLASKASKADIASTRWLWADADPEKLRADELANMREDEIGVHYAAERSLIRQAIEACRPEPTVVVDSGNGYQAFWRLDEPLVDLEAAEAMNRWLGQMIGDRADHTWNVDRIMRLPGTPNRPTEVKRRAGITWVSEASVV